MGPTQEALALADFLISRYGLTADRYQLAYAIMEHEENAMRETPEQPAPVVGGDWQRTIRALHLAVGLNPDKPNADALLGKVTALLAARPGGEETDGNR